MVVMEMSLAFFSILFNLVVLISIRERESLLNSTVNVILANLCAANLVSAVFVKSIAVVYNGYAVARCVPNAASDFLRCLYRKSGPECWPAMLEVYMRIFRGLSQVPETMKSQPRRLSCCICKLNANGGKVLDGRLPRLGKIFLKCI